MVLSGASFKPLSNLQWIRPCKKINGILPFMRLKVLRGLKTANIPFICPLMAFWTLPLLRQKMCHCYLLSALKAKGKTPSGWSDPAILCNVISKPGVLELQHCRSQPRISGSSRERGHQKFRCFTNVLQFREVVESSQTVLTSQKTVFTLLAEWIFRYSKHTFPTWTPRTHHQAKRSSFMLAGPLELLTNFT